MASCSNATPQKTVTRVTRTLSNRAFIGHSCQDLPSDGLASVVDVLRVIAFLREDPKNKNKSVSSLCCPCNKEKTMLCQLEGGCLGKGEPCLAFKVKLKWLQAGILTVSDVRIKERLTEEQDEYNKMYRHRNRMTPAAREQRTKFEVEIKKTFNVMEEDARQVIQNDLSRSEQAKEEDLAFFDDYLCEGASRTWRLGKKDNEYSEVWMNSFLTAAAKVTRKEEKDQRMRARRETEDLEYQERHRTTLDEDEDVEDEEGEEEQRLDRQDVDYVGEEKKRKRCKRNGGDGDDGDSEDDDDGVWAKIPREILKLTAPAAMRMEFSHSDHVVIISAFLKACKVDLDEFPLSVSTSYRRRKEVMEEVYEESRNSFRDEALMENWPIFLHADTKELTDTIGPHGASVKNKRERLAVVLTSPFFEGAKFVCAPGLEGGTGRHQAEGAIAGCTEMGVIELVSGTNYDTTASNSSPAVGTVALIEEHKGEQILKIPCRHHIYDLFGKNLSKVISGKKSTGPGNPLFVRFAREWPNLVDSIDYNNIVSFDQRFWHGSFVDQLVVEVSTWARHAFLNATFPKNSWYDLLAAIIKFLGADLPTFNYRFKKPKEVSNARFAEPAEFYLVMAMLSR